MLNDDFIQFGKFSVSKEQIFYQSASELTLALVNLRPIVKGHVLVVPKRVVPKLSMLTDIEYQELWQSVRIIQSMLQEWYSDTTDKSSNSNLSFNVAVQDGKAAGQSVPHVHVHILPRIEGDFPNIDDVYTELEEWAPNTLLIDIKKKKAFEETSSPHLEVPSDED
eukprot:CAMPEP_0184860852 /NCGR_PEP_ID=MMETSP0580-20130426/5658_1 /TAXON_ID=1118495 /ORGANISM="Dactyliosolen fragilissimus" /LENGTH=165 /DNA_ID=CAMNT_0027358107 /DNA_START=214 /DNA_END=708 /DNA_ORIENTATION=-